MSMNGIDISNWQNGINLEIVPCDFVIMKATQGTSYVSPDCDRQYQQAKAAGKLLGVYHYAAGNGAMSEADFFLKNIKGYLGQAILVLDWESGDNTSWANGPAYTKQFLDRIYNQTGIRALLYMSKSVCTQFDWSAIAINHGLWVAQYGSNTVTNYQSNPWTDNNSYGAWRSPAIFQYSSSGRLSGYSGNLDLNIAYMDATAWNKYAGKENVIQPTTPAGSLSDLVIATIQGTYGNGNERKQKLGSRYKEVQDMINYIANANANTLAAEVIQGKYGNGVTRKSLLGNRYTEIQTIVNTKTKSNEQYYTIQTGDTLSALAIKYKTTVAQLQKWNGIANANLIYSGQKIRVK